MPTISKIRFTNVVYENGQKRYNDEIFHFGSENSAIVLENGGGKTVFIQAAIQAILPHETLAGRKIKDTLCFDDGHAHIAIEWLLNDKPRHYGLTAITLYPYENGVQSHRYVYEYGLQDVNRIESIPFSVATTAGNKRPASQGEMKDYYSSMQQNHMNAHTFSTITNYKEYLEKHFHIITGEWQSIVKINSAEGGVEAFFEACTTEKALFEKLLIPTVEGALVQYDEQQFANIFEKHREHFKKYKLLKEQLAEYHLIQKELAQYEAVYATYDDLLTQYAETQMIAKRYYTIIEESTAETMQQMEKNDEQYELHDQQQIHYQQLQKHYDIAVVEEQVQAADEQYKEAEEIATRQQERIDGLQLERANIEYASKQQQYKQEQAQIQSAKAELTQQEEQISETALLDQLDSVKRQLKGSYIAKKELFAKEQQAAEQQLQKLQETLKQEQAQANNVDQQLRSEEIKLEVEKSILSTLRKTIAQQLKQLMLDEGDVIEARLTWANTAQQLDEEIIQLQQDNKQLGDLQVVHNKQLEHLQHEKSQLLQEQSTIQNNYDAYEQKSKQLQQNLQLEMPSISRTRDLLVNEAAIIHQVENHVEHKNKAYEKSLLAERRIRRFEDDYGEQTTFFADPYVSSQLSQWKNQVPFLQTGIEYFQHSEEIFQPLLAIMLITDQPTIIQQKLMHDADKLLYPIQVLTLEQATTLTTDHSYIEPALWTNNRQLASFEQWQQTIHQQAEEATNTRRVMQHGLSKARDVLHTLQQFYDVYNLEKIQHMTAQLQQLQRDLFDCQQALRKTTELKGQQAKLVEQNRQKITEQKQVKEGLDGKVEKALQIEKQLREQKERQQKIIYMEGQYEQQRKKVAQQKKLVQQLADQLEHEKESVQQIKLTMQSYFDRRPLYETVQQEEPLFTELTYEQLAEQYQILTRRIEGVTRGREELLKQMQQAEKRAKQLQIDLEDLLQEYPTINETIEVEHAREQLSNLKKMIVELQQELQRFIDDKIQAKSNYDMLNGQLEQLQKQVSSSHRFTEPLPIVAQQLKEMTNTLQKQAQSLKKQQDYLRERQKKYNELIQKLNIENAKHSFNHPDIKASILSAQQQRDFSYNEVGYIQQIVSALTAKQMSLEKQQQQVEQVRQQFMQFCRNEISDFRMRGAVIQGLSPKMNYENVVQHRQQLEKTIQMSIQIAEHNMQTYTNDLEQFIQHIHTHLRKILEELEMIPRYTRIQINEESVPMFRFTIPTWTDEEGLQLIRQRIDYILDQLDHDFYKGEDGQEDMPKVRKQLEQWFSSIQLLRIVMQNKELRVTCRKVSNDQRVSKSMESWSRSNAWSGGEKWSKNMALFLGILKYVAEKRQVTYNRGRNRVVIVDNPFGKASSDHVLSPVFFIAEQLGFQMIALTAHMEGKFLHDYFPVVYSCRLRTAAGTSKQIMQLKKTMQQAFFHDFNPAQEVEQLSLFE